jgi:hypothetical protein
MAMPSPTGVMSITLANVRALLAASPTWQQLCFDDDVAQGLRPPDADPDDPTLLAAGLGRIHFFGLPKPGRPAEFSAEELALRRPYAMSHFDFGEQRRAFEYVRFGRATYYDRGLVLLRVALDVPTAYQQDPDWALMDANNRVGLIAQEMAAVADAGDYFAPSSIELAYGPVRWDPRDVPGRGIFTETAFRLMYGETPQ